MISLRAAVIIGVAGVCFSAGWKVSEWRSESILAEQYRLEEERRAEGRRLVQQVARQTQDAISQIRIENRTIYQKTRREVIRDPVYIDCFVPADGSRLLNEARAAGNDRLSADGTVPANADDPDPG